LTTQSASLPLVEAVRLTLGTPAIFSGAVSGSDT
jgi:hypothetical protein